MVAEVESGLFEDLMQLALREAEKGLGNTGPNPLVGAVIWKDGKVVATGYHALVGSSHAEVAAIEKAGDLCKGATLVVNLEPCSRYGRTPPCADAIIKAGFRRVVVGMLDPNPRERGRGVQKLKEAGIEVVVGVLEKECRRLNEAYIKYITTGVPFVTLKLAVTLDGKIATRLGLSQWITGTKARQFVQQLRYESDAILVGAGTVRADDPSLTVRVGKKLRPFIRCVASRNLRLPAGGRVFRHVELHPTCVFISRTVPDRLRKLFTGLGAELIEVELDDSGLDLRQILAVLARKEVCRLLVEGGAKLASALVQLGLVDRLVMIYAPKIFGGDGIDAFEPMGVSSVRDGYHGRVERIERLGEDVAIVLRLGRDWTKYEL